MAAISSDDLRGVAMTIFRPGNATVGVLQSSGAAEE